MPNETTERPNWLDQTPECFYEFTAGSERNGEEQNISLTKEEYDAVKVYLAKLRGYEEPPKPAESKPVEMPEATPAVELEPSSDLIERAYRFHVGGAIDQLATDVNLARHVFREHPDLVKARQFPKAFKPFRECEDADYPVASAALKKLAGIDEAEARKEAIALAKVWMTNGVAKNVLKKAKVAKA